MALKLTGLVTGEVATVLGFTSTAISLVSERCEQLVKLFVRELHAFAEEEINEVLLRDGSAALTELGEQPGGVFGVPFCTMESPTNTEDVRIVGAHAVVTLIHERLEAFCQGLPSLHAVKKLQPGRRNPSSRSGFVSEREGDSKFKNMFEYYSNTT